MGRMFSRLMKKRDGFTLVELLVVVVIIAILSSIVIGVVPAAAQRSKRAAFGQTMATLQSAADRFYVESNKYPTKVDIESDNTVAEIDLTATDGLGATFLGGYVRFEPEKDAVDCGLKAADGATVYYGIARGGKVFATQDAPVAGTWEDVANKEAYTQENPNTPVAMNLVK